MVFNRVNHIRQLISILFLPFWRHYFWSLPSSCPVLFSRSTVQLLALDLPSSSFWEFLLFLPTENFFFLGYSFILKHSQLVSFKKWVGGTFFSWDCMTKCIFVLASYLVDIELRIAINLEIIFPGILKALLYILIASNIAIKV